MFIKEFFIKVLEIIKKTYILLFNFMIGTETNKFSKIYVHLATILLFAYSPFHYYNFAINFSEIVEGVAVMAHLVRVILIFLLPVIFACGVKVMLLFK